MNNQQHTPTSVRVFAPATVANMICGFDILGFALERPGDEVWMERCKEPGVRILSIEGDEGKLPLEAKKNTVSASVQHLLNVLGEDSIGFNIRLTKRMPIGSGLGSSAASTVAGLYAANRLLGEPLSARELLDYAVRGEELACGHGHADNVAPALMGGITLIRSYRPLDVISLPVPQKLMVSIVFPNVEVPTRDARKMIRETLPLRDAVTQWGNIAGLVASLYRQDYKLMSASMQDLVAEPSRSILIPGFDRMRELAIYHGALSFGISGSGPSVFALSTDTAHAEKITDILRQHLTSLGIDSLGFVSKINTAGPRELPPL